MNTAQRLFVQLGLILLAGVLFSVSWKFLEPDSFWMHWSYRIVFHGSDGQEFGLESRFKDLSQSVLIGFVLPALALGVATFMQLGKKPDT